MESLTKEDRAVGQLIRAMVHQKGFESCRQAGKALFADLGQVFGLSENTCGAYVTDLCTGLFYMGTASSHSRTKPLMLYRLSKFLQWLEVPSEDEIIHRIKGLYHEFSYPSLSPPYKEPSSNALSLEERVKLLRPSHQQVVGCVVDALLETYRQRTNL